MGWHLSSKFAWQFTGEYLNEQLWYLAEKKYSSASKQTTWITDKCPNCLPRFWRRGLLEKERIYSEKSTKSIRIYNWWEGYIENPSRGSLSGITRLAEWNQTVIARDGFFYLPLTTSRDSFSRTSFISSPLTLWWIPFKQKTTVLCLRSAQTQISKHNLRLWSIHTGLKYSFGEQCSP